jgi:hypothetical protein
MLIGLNGGYLTMHMFQRKQLSQAAWLKRSKGIRVPRHILKAVGVGSIVTNHFGRPHAAACPAAMPPRVSADL